MVKIEKSLDALGIYSHLAKLNVIHGDHLPSPKSLATRTVGKSDFERSLLAY
jgi:hypothetical protein